jgi:hypothetical protein
MKTNVYFTGHGSGQVPRQGSARQSGSGGGARVVERDAHKVEPRSFAMSPAGVSQYGSAMGNHVSGGGGRTVQGGVTSVYAGPGYNNVGPTPCGEGPGAGRTVQPHGGQHGLVKDPEPQHSSHKGWEPNPGVKV